MSLPAISTPLMSIPSVPTKEFTNFLKIMKKNSIVLFSGFFESDIDYIKDLSFKSGLKILYSDLENQWALLVMIKK